MSNPFLGGTVDGKNPAPVEVGSLSHYLQGFSTIPGGFLAGFRTNHQQYDWMSRESRIDVRVEDGSYDVKMDPMMSLVGQGCPLDGCFRPLEWGSAVYILIFRKMVNCC